MECVLKKTSQFKASFKLAKKRGLDISLLEDVVILTNGFQKKTQKTPANEIEICKERMKDFLSRGTKK